MQKIGGTHLIVDAYVAHESVLDPQLVLACFDSVISELGMQKLGLPMVLGLLPDPARLVSDLDEGGYSIIVPIATSHLSAHTWPLRRAIMLDIFSCRDFDVERAYNILATDLQFVEVNRQVIQRRDPLELGQLKSFDVLNADLCRFIADAFQAVPDLCGLYGTRDPSGTVTLYAVVEDHSDVFYDKGFMALDAVQDHFPGVVFLQRVLARCGREPEEVVAATLQLPPQTRIL